MAQPGLFRPLLLPRQTVFEHHLPAHEGGKAEENQTPNRGMNPKQEQAVMLHPTMSCSL